jgi:hypothetical protein
MGQTRFYLIFHAGVFAQNFTNFVFQLKLSFFEMSKEIVETYITIPSNKVKPNTDVLDDEDDDTPQLSAHALAALHDFYDEQAEIQKALEAAGNDNSILFKTDLAKFFPEDWVRRRTFNKVMLFSYLHVSFQQLSQFWYDEITAKKLAEEVLTQAGPGGRIVCISSPSIFRACQVSDNGKICSYYFT